MVANGVHAVELDVTLLKDGTLAVWHDETIDRCSDRTGLVRDLTREDLKTIDVGAWFHPDFAGERMSLFEDTLALLQDLNVAVNVEIKIHQDEAIALTQKTIAALMQHWKDPSQLLVSSFNWECLHHARSLAPDMRLGLLMEDLVPDWVQTAETLNAYSIHCEDHMITPELISEVHAHGYELYVYTVNDPAIAAEMLSQGVDAIMSDYPEKIALPS